MGRQDIARGAHGRSAAQAQQEPTLVGRLEAPGRPDLDIWELPRGQHKLAAADITASQRARIFYALVHSVAAKGYTATTLSDICGLARLSRSSFYAHFDSKETCYLAAYEAAHDELVSVVIGSQRADAGWEERLRDSLRAYLGYNRDNPAVARSFLVEVHAVGVRAWQKRDWGREVFARMQKTLYERRRATEPQLPVLPDEIFLAAVTGVEEMVCAYVRKGMTARMLELEPLGLFLLQSLYNAGPASLQYLEAPAPPSGAPRRLRR